MSEAQREAEVLRSFNRAYARLASGYVGPKVDLDLPPAGARVLAEIGDGVLVRSIRDRLGFDSGYLTRLLRQLEEGGFVTVEVDTADRRRRLVVLTDRGQDACRRRDVEAERQAASVAACLAGPQRARFVELIAAADLVLRAATVPIRVVPASAPANHVAVRRHREELPHLPMCGCVPGESMVVVAHLHAVDGALSVACGQATCLRDGGAEVTHLWVHPDWRGVGLGRRLSGELEQVRKG